jgi:hypothetical protein
MFTSADTPASVEGNSAAYPSTPVGTSTVYPGVPFTDAGHQFVVTAAATLDSIAVTLADPSAPAGETDQFTAIGTFSNNSTKNLTGQVTWASSATAVATISNATGSQGLATSIRQGQTTISATLDGITGSTALNVGPAVLVSLSLEPVKPFAAIGSTEQLTAIGTFSDNTTENVTNELSWSSDTTSVATVSNLAGSKGLATGVQSGTSTISAWGGGVTGQVVLSVTPILKSLVVTPADPSVPKGESEGFTATGTFADNSTENLTSDVVWASANTATATISNKAGSLGVASALATGTSSISASFEGVTSASLLTVSPPVLESISVSPTSPTVIDGATDQFAASGLYSDNSTQNLTTLVTWNSTAPLVATVSSAGLATGVAPGKSTISATYQGITGSNALTVSPPLVTLTSVDPIVNRRKVTKVVVTFSGSLEAALAQEAALYQFKIAAKNGLFTSRSATTIRVRKAEYSAASPNTVTLIPMTPFTLSKSVELRINGLPPSGLEDSLGRLIDGDEDGQPGGDAVAIVA